MLTNNVARGLPLSRKSDDFPRLAPRPRGGGVLSTRSRYAGSSVHRREGAASTMATAADRFNINSQLEHLQTRYVGTGHADTNRFEWAVNIHRDSYASYVGRHSMTQYFALAENESIGRVRYNMMQVRPRRRRRFSPGMGERGRVTRPVALVRASRPLAARQP